jgi:hypothetical protein
MTDMLDDGAPTHVLGEALAFAQIRQDVLFVAEPQGGSVVSVAAATIKNGHPVWPVRGAGPNHKSWPLSHCASVIGLSELLTSGMMNSESCNCSF